MSLAGFEVAPVTLEGQLVVLKPLQADHLDALCEVGLSAELWRWTNSRVRNREEMKAYMAQALAEQKEGHVLPFVTIHKAENRVVGSTRFGNIVSEHGRVEIGWTWVALPWQRSGVNTEVKYLMLNHAFEYWNCNRVELKTDALNKNSRRAIARIGATEEGTLRNHMIMADGRLRNSVYFSIIRSEWPLVKRKLEKMLDR